MFSYCGFLDLLLLLLFFESCCFEQKTKRGSYWVKTFKRDQSYNHMSYRQCLAAHVLQYIQLGHRPAPHVVSVIALTTSGPLGDTRIHNLSPGATCYWQQLGTCCIYWSVLHRAGCCADDRDRDASRKRFNQAAAAPKLHLCFGTFCAFLGDGRILLEE